MVRAKTKTIERYKRVVDEWFNNGKVGLEAWRKEYPNASYISSDSSFRDMMKRQEVIEYVEEKQAQEDAKIAKIAEKNMITLESQIEELTKIKAQCIESSKYRDAIEAIKEQNKLLGLYEAHNKQKQGDIDFNMLDNEILMQIFSAKKH